MGKYQGPFCHLSRLYLMDGSKWVSTKDHSVIFLGYILYYLICKNSEERQPNMHYKHVASVTSGIVMSIPKWWVYCLGFLNGEKTNGHSNFKFGQYHGTTSIDLVLSSC